jgi:hemoglobin-like flavoprotein
MSVSIQAPVVTASNRLAQSRAATSAGAPSLTARQKHVIRESLLRLEPALDLVGTLFLRKLFQLDPSLRARFDGPAETQGRKFMAGLKLTIISLNHEDGLAPTLKLLGVRHRQLGIKLRHYRIMARALMWTLEQSLGKGFTRETKNAWTALLSQLTRILTV